MGGPTKWIFHAPKIAASKGHLDALKTLAEAGADLNRISTQGHTALSYAIIVEAPEAVRYLLGRGVSAKTAPAGVDAPLMVAATFGSAKTIPILAEAGANVNALTSYETVELSALMMASARQHTAAVKALLGSGANVNLAGKGGATALHLAAIAGCFDCVQALVASGATVDVRNDANGTPLRSAAEGGHAKIVKFLLARGAKPSARDDMGLLPIDYAVKKCHSEVVKLLE
jgi:ankyrin repeat protein